MENMQVVNVYNLVNSKGNWLQLELGLGDCTNNEYPKDASDNGYRWRFFGSSIPMPVRAGYWFNGFPEGVMLDWLNGNGWYPRTKVNMRTGHAKVYELPDVHDPSKGNENTYKLSDLAIEQGECALKRAIKMMSDDGYKLSAITLYRYVHPCTLPDAKNAIDKILQLDN